MLPIGFADRLLLLEVEANDGLIRRLDGLLLLDTCGGMVSMRVRVVSGRARRRRGVASTATARPRRGPRGLKISQKHTQRLL